MNWDNKIELVRLGNKRQESIVTRKNYEDFVLANIDSFDGQAIDMFITNETLIKEELLERKEFYIEVVKRLTVLMEDKAIYDKVGLRADLRIGILEELIKE